MNRDIKEKKSGELVNHERSSSLNADENKSYFKRSMNNPLTKFFTYCFFLFFMITITLGMIYDLNPDIFGLIVLILFPFISGFFFLNLLYPLIFQRQRNKKSFEKKYNRSIMISSLVLCIPIWILGILNMFIGLFIFVFILVGGNLSTMFEKGNKLYQKVPANKPFSLFLIMLALILPLVFFGIKVIGEVGLENILNMSAVFAYLLTHGIILLFGYVSVLIVCPISIVIIVFSKKEVGKRLALFCILFVWLIMTWIYEFIGDFSLTQIAIAQLPILLITLYNIFSQVKREVKDIDKSVKKAESNLIYKIFNRKSDNEVLKALIFVLFCSSFFGYLTAKTSLSIITTALNMWGIFIPDMGILVPNVVSIIIALIIVVPFLLINTSSLNRKF